MQIVDMPSPRDADASKNTKNVRSGPGRVEVKALQSSQLNANKYLSIHL